jgi:hypothetical protein
MKDIGHRLRDLELLLGQNLPFPVLVLVLVVLLAFVARLARPTPNAASQHLQRTVTTSTIQPNRCAAPQPQIAAHTLVHGHNAVREPNALRVHNGTNGNA